MKLRNVAIIAHVDHGKTTLVDGLLQQSGAVRDNQRVAERALDSNDLERERGITILAKVTSILWHDTRINIVDTPGHADFGGEVERILNMVDGALVLVDAAEGPLPQTKFVVAKALKVGLKPIVVINKVDRPDGRPLAVVNEVFDLFAALEASEDWLDSRVLYGWAGKGWMAASADGQKDKGRARLFNLVPRHVAEPIIEDGPFRMLGTILEANPYLGRIVTGRISSGAVRPNQSVKVLDRNGKLIEHGRVTKVLAFRGLERTGVEETSAGDIVAIAGLPEATVSHTICAPEVTEPLPAQPIDPPTLAMTFRINDSPLAGTEGDKVQSRVIRERLRRVSRRDRRPPQRRSDLQRPGRGRGLRAVEPRGPRPDDDRAGVQGLSRHDRGRAYPRQRPRDQRAQGQEAHQYPHPCQGRGRAADPADPDDVGEGARLYRRRRAGRGHPGRDQAAQEAARSQRAQEGGPAQGGGAGVTPGRWHRPIRRDCRA